MTILFNNEIPTRIYFWNKERGLLGSPPSHRLHLSFLLEESSEYYRATDVEQEVDALGDIVVFCIGWLYKLHLETPVILTTPDFIEDDIIGLIYDISKLFDCGLQDEAIEAINKLIKNCLNGMFYLGYDPNITMDEVLKHISSRVGSVDETGKWTKDKTAVIYQPNFKSALIAPEVLDV